MNCTVLMTPESLAEEITGRGVGVIGFFFKKNPPSLPNSGLLILTLYLSFFLSLLCFVCSLCPCLSSLSSPSLQLSLSLSHASLSTFYQVPSPLLIFTPPSVCPPSQPCYLLLVICCSASAALSLYLLGG